MPLQFTLQLAPWLSSVGQALIDLDEDKEEADDFVGELFVFVADAGAAVEAGEDLPAFPDALANGVTGKITGVLRPTLQFSNTIIAFAQFQVSDVRLRKVMKYANQALSSLLAGRPVKPADVTIVNV